MIAELANLSVTTWLVLLGCVVVLHLYGWLCWTGDHDG